MTPQTVVHQAHFCPWEFPGKNTAVDFHFLDINIENWALTKEQVIQWKNIEDSFFSKGFSHYGIFSPPIPSLFSTHTHKILYPLQKLTQVDHSLKCKEDIFSGILLSHEKEWNNAICSNMDGHRDYHTKNEVKQRTTNVWNWLCMTFKKMIQVNLCTKQK